MQTIPTLVWENLLWLIYGVPDELWNIFFPSPKLRSVEEQVVEKIKRQSSTIQNQQDRLVYKVRNEKELHRIINEQADRLRKKDKEIRDLNDRLRRKR